jgi:hypothetical protein
MIVLQKQPSSRIFFLFDSAMTEDDGARAIAILCVLDVYL